MNKIIVVVLFLLFCSANLNFEAKADDLILDFDKIKTKLPFKKKKEPQKPKMPETKQEWEIESQNIPLEDREVKIEEPEIDTKKFHVPEAKYVFEAYNYPQGTRELNFEEVKNKLFHYSFLIADNNFQYAAYSHYYYAPDSNQISSNFFVEKLDTSKTKTKRILEYRHKQKERIPVVEAGIKDMYSNLFRGLTLVDWSKDSKKLLIKEKIGSTQNGVYKTILHVHFLEDEINSSKTIRLDDFDSAIKHYFLDWENKQIVRYRYDITPLGFSEENDDIVVAICYVYDNDKNKIFLGTWGYNLKTKETILLSKENLTPKISVNGIFLKRVFD